MFEKSVMLEGIEYRFTHSGQECGGSGTVCKCVSPFDDNLMLKIIRDDSDPIKIKRFLHEIEFQKEHISGVVPVIASGFLDEEKKHPCYVMPRYECNLSKKMHEERSIFDSMDWFIQLCDIVANVHARGVIHRDIKPQNILFKEGKIYLADFGIAHIPNYKITGKNDRLANFNYHSPEQMIGSEMAVTFASDVYSMGLILNELFTGKVPHGSDYEKVRDVCPLFGFVDDVVDQMLIVDPNKRLSDLRAISSHLRYSTDMIRDGYEEWLDDIDYSRFPEDFIDSDLELIYSDIMSANFLLNSPIVDWNNINCNYHKNFNYDLDRILNLVIFLRIMEKVELKFNYEGNNCYRLSDGFYETLDKSNRYDEMIQKFRKILDDLKIDKFGYYALTEAGRCLNYFRCLQDKHAEEVLDDVGEIVNKVRYNCIGAPILWVSAYIHDIVVPICKILEENELKLEHYVSINWDMYSHELDSLPLYGESRHGGFFPDLELDAVLSSLRDTYPNMSVLSTDCDSWLYFTDWAEWLDFRNRCNKIIDSNIDSILVADVNNVLYKSSEYGDIVRVCLDNFDLTHTIPFILGNSSN